MSLTYSASPENAAEVVSAIGAAGGDGFAIKADSRDASGIRAAVDAAVERFGPLDAAVVAAGVLRLGTIETMSVEDLDLTIEVNIRGVFLAVQAAAARMRDGGSVVTIGSNTAIRAGRPGGSAYSMSKAAVASMVKGFALDLAPRRITVNNVQPGPTLTDMTASMAAALEEIIPLKRMAAPDEIASMVAYLVGDEARFVTGASLTIDGGLML